MKYLILFLIIVAIFAWLAWRFRRQIAIARQMLKMLSDARRMVNEQQQRQQQQAGGHQTPESVPAGKLVRCEKCQTWVPQDTALNFGGNTYFCSARCMESSVINV